MHIQHGRKCSGIQKNARRLQTKWSLKQYGLNKNWNGTYLLQNFPVWEFINISCVPAVTCAQMDRVVLIALLRCNQVWDNVTAMVDNQNTVKLVLNGIWAWWNLPLTKKFYSLHEQNLKYLYETDPACNGKICPLWLGFRQVSLYSTVYKA